ncbi:MAG: hypothetical protein AAF541_14110 [Pseudomonadota bacterium]
MYKYFGHFDMHRKPSIVKLMVGLCLLTGASTSHGLDGVELLDAAWVGGVETSQPLSVIVWAGSESQENQALLDEQIFTELSPILQSGEQLKLPPDQLLTD